MCRSSRTLALVVLPAALVLLASSGPLGCAEERPAPIIVAHATPGADDAGLLAALGAAFTKRERVPVRWIPRVAEASDRRPKPDVELLSARRTQVPQGETGRIIWVERLLVVGPPRDRRSYGEQNYLLRMKRRGVLGSHYPLREASAKVLIRNLRPAGSVFVSRGDESLVHRVERMLWGKRGPHPDARYYVETGEGMATTLEKASEWADEKRAYTLTDEATFLRLRAELELDVVLGADPILEVAVTAVPTDEDAGEAADSTRLVRWLKSDEAKAIIRGFTVSEARPFCPSEEPVKWTLHGRLDPEPEEEEGAGEDAE